MNNGAMQIFSILDQIAAILRPEAERLMKADKSLTGPDAYTQALGLMIHRRAEVVVLTQREAAIYHAMLARHDRQIKKRPLTRGEIESELTEMTFSYNTMLRTLYSLRDKNLVQQFNRTWLAVRVDGAQETQRKAA